MLTPGRPPLRGYSMRQLQDCAERETNYRRYVYAKQVREGKKSQQIADAEIDKMAAIGELLAELAGKERLL